MGRQALNAIARETEGAHTQLVTLGQNIKKLREAAGFVTQTAFAEALGVSQPRLNDWENDRRQFLELPSLLLIAKTLQRPIDDIIEGLDPVYDLICHDPDVRSSATVEKPDSSPSLRLPHSEPERITEAHKPTPTAVRERLHAQVESSGASSVPFVVEDLNRIAVELRSAIAESRQALLETVGLIAQQLNEFRAGYERGVVASGLAALDDKTETDEGVAPTRPRNVRADAGRHVGKSPKRKRG